MPVPTPIMLCCCDSVNRECNVESLSPFISAELVKPAVILSFQACENQGLLDAWANF